MVQPAKNGRSRGQSVSSWSTCGREAWKTCTSKPEHAPENVAQAAFSLVAAPDSYSLWKEWYAALRFAEGWEEALGNRAPEFRRIVCEGYRGKGANFVAEVTTGQRLAAVEHLLDVVPYATDEFVEVVNSRARWWHVGVRTEGRRFVPLTCEHLHYGGRAAGSHTAGGSASSGGGADRGVEHVSAVPW
jgi:hypothetical protein